MDPTLPDDGDDPIVSGKHIAARLGVHPSTISRWADRGSFPAKVPLGERRIGWRRSAVEAWLSTR